MDRKTRRWARRVLDTRLAELASLPKEEVHTALDQAKEVDATKQMLWRVETDLRRLQSKTGPVMKLAQELVPNETDPDLIAMSLSKVISAAQNVLPVVSALEDGLTRISRSLILFDHNGGAIDNVIADIRSVLQETDGVRKQAQAFKTLDVISSVSQFVGRDLFGLRGLDAYSFGTVKDLMEDTPEPNEQQEKENGEP